MSATRRAAATPRKPSAAQRAAEAAKLQAALTWPSFPEPQPLDDDARKALLDARRETAAVDGDVVPAWTYNVSLRDVVHGCFSSNQHSTRSHVRTTTQTCGGPWFQTRREAAEALAWAVTRDCAQTLVYAMEHVERLRSDAQPTE